MTLRARTVRVALWILDRYFQNASYEIRLGWADDGCEIRMQHHIPFVDCAISALTHDVEFSEQLFDGYIPV
jgi:hypothetical protein